MIDTHSHIYLPEFKEDLQSVVDRALAAGVDKILLPNIDSSTMDDLLDCVSKYPSVCYPMTGLHPTSVNESYTEELDFVRNSLNGENKFIAIGEIGLDLYWDKTFLKEQMIAFDSQVSLAVENELPVVIHCRDAFDEMFEVLSGYKNNAGFKGVVHSFSGQQKDVEEILSYKNLYIGINGTVTFKKSHLPDLLRNVPVEKILQETDSPYLTPSPFRGKRNESSYVIYVLSKLSEVYQIDKESMAHILTENANRLFCL